LRLAFDVTHHVETNERTIRFVEIGSGGEEKERAPEARSSMNYAVKAKEP
jgi:hypothetical protein